MKSINMDKSAEKARDDYYNKLKTKMDEDIFDPTWPLKTRILKERTLSNVGVMERDRFLHRKGYVTKGRIFEYPAIARISIVKLTKNLRNVGLGVRYWIDKDNYKDLVLLDIIQGKEDNNHSLKLSNSVYNTIPTSITNLLIIGITFGIFLTTGKNPFIINASDLGHGIEKFQKITAIPQKYKTYDEIVNSKKKTIWDIYNYKNEKIGNMELDPFNKDPNFGYDLLFKHELKNLF